MRAADSIKGVAGENLRKVLDWLPQGRRLVTVMTDCDLKDHVHGWPALDALALQPLQREELLQFYIRYGFKAWRKELEDSLGIIATATATPPAAKTAARRALRGPLATLALPQALRDRADHRSARRVDRQARCRAAGRDRHRDRFARPDQGARWSASRSRSLPARPPMCRSATAMPARPSNCRARVRARQAEALARGREQAQARPAHQVRHACVRQPRHRRARLRARHAAAKLCARGAQAARARQSRVSAISTAAG